MADALIRPVASCFAIPQRGDRVRVKRLSGLCLRGHRDGHMHRYAVGRGRNGRPARRNTLQPRTEALLSTPARSAARPRWRPTDWLSPSVGGANSTSWACLSRPGARGSLHGKRKANRHPPWHRGIGRRVPAAPYRAVEQHVGPHVVVGCRKRHGRPPPPRNAVELDQICPYLRSSASTHTTMRPNARLKPMERAAPHPRLMPRRVSLKGRDAGLPGTPPPPPYCPRNCCQPR